jgi:hypothetical protein
MPPAPGRGVTEGDNHLTSGGFRGCFPGVSAGSLRAVSQVGPFLMNLL